MGQITVLIGSMADMIMPRSHKTQVYYAINFLFLLMAILGYWHKFLRFIGIIYTLIVGITLFAGLKALEQDGNAGKEGYQ